MVKVFILGIVCLLEVYDFIKEYKNTFKKKLHSILFLGFRIVVIILLGWFAIDEFLDQKKEVNINARKGEFGSQKDALNGYPVIKYSTNTAKDINLFGPNKGKSVSRFNNTQKDPVTITVENDQIQIEAYIRDSKGDSYAEIHGRTWEITNSGNIDYNNDKTAFEIMYAGRVLFQIELKPDTVSYKGLICSDYGQCQFYDDSGFSVMQGKDPGTQRFILPYNYNLDPIFKYPRFQYLGRRAIKGIAPTVKQ